MADTRSQLKARVEQLLAAGKSREEILAMKPQLLASVGAGDRAYQGPTPGGGIVETPEAPAPKPEPPSSPGMLDTLMGMGKLAARGVGEFIDDPKASGRAAIVGGAKSATMGRAKDLHGPALARMRAKAAAGPLDASDLQTLSMWQDVASPGRERTPITDPMAVIDELSGRHGAAQEDIEGHQGAQFLGAMGVAPATLPARVGGVAAGAVGKAAGPGAGAVKRTLAAAGGGAAGGGVGSLTADAIEGNFDGILDRAATSAKLGGAISGATSLAGQALQGTRSAVANSKGGKARQLIESEGGNVGPFSSGDQGPFAPGGRLAGRKPDSRGIGETSRESAVNILRRQDADLATDLASPLGKKAALDAQNRGHVVVNDLVDEMGKLLDGEVLSPGEMGTVDSWLRRLHSYSVDVDGKPTGVYAMSPKALNEFRTMLDGATGVGEAPGTVAKAKMQGVANAARALVGETEYGAVNQEIHGARNKYEQGRRLLRLNDQPAGGARTPEDLPRSEVERVTQMMARQNQNTTTAGGQNTSVDDGSPVPGSARENLDQLAEQFPQHRTDVRMPQVLDAKGELQYRLLPRSDAGGLLERVKSAAPTVAGALAGGASAMGGHPVLGALLGAGTLGATNLPAIQGRLAYRPAMMAGGVGDAMTAGAPQMGSLAASLRSPLEALLAAKPEKKQKKGKRK